MRIAIIVSRIELCGPIKVIQSLVNSIDTQHEFNIKIYYLDKKTDPQIQIKVPVEKFKFRSFSFKDYDIIHTNGIRPDFFAFINRRKIKCHISTIHNLVFEDLKYSFNWFISLIFGKLWLVLWARADKLICVSETMKTYYLRWFPSSKLEVIRNGISEYESSDLPDNDIIDTIKIFRSNGLKVIGCVGILTKRKGIDQILSLLEIEKELACIIIGEGKELSRLKHLARRLKITERTFFCGIQYNAAQYFRLFDLFIIPSRSEGFGLVLIEAVQQKVPVICSDIQVFKELFNSDEVTYYNLDNIKSLESALKESVEKGKNKVELAYSRYRKSYTDIIMAEKYCVQYQSLRC